MYKWGILVFFCICVSILCGYFFVNNWRIGNALKELAESKEKEFSLKLSNQKELIEKELHDKYQEDAFSFKEMFMRLEKERKLVRELEEKLNKQNIEKTKH